MLTFSSIICIQVFLFNLTSHIQIVREFTLGTLFTVSILEVNTQDCLGVGSKGNLLGYLYRLKEFCKFITLLLFKCLFVFLFLFSLHITILVTSRFFSCVYYLYIGGCIAFGLTLNLLNISLNLS